MLIFELQKKKLYVYIIVHIHSKNILTLLRLGGFGDFRKKKQQFSVALPTP